MGIIVVKCRIVRGIRRCEINRPRAALGTEICNQCNYGRFSGRTTCTTGSLACGTPDRVAVIDDVRGGLGGKRHGGAGGV